LMTAREPGYMSGECHFCNGTISGFESDHILLEDHGDHEVYMHERCAAGHDIIEQTVEGGTTREITCPVCGTVETR